MTENTDKILELVERLKEKYNADNQPVEGYLEGFAYQNYLDYWDYIHVDALLSLQAMRTNVPDEMIFIADTLFNGEIIDPKCYFGVMKPGRGKVHRECAIRCISGGIPPVLWVKQNNMTYQYCLLLGPNGEKINQLVLPFVADPVELKGKLFHWGNWLVMKMSEIKCN